MRWRLSRNAGLSDPSCTGAHTPPGSRSLGPAYQPGRGRDAPTRAGRTHAHAHMSSHSHMHTDCKHTRVGTHTRRDLPPSSLRTQCGLPSPDLRQSLRDSVLCPLQTKAPQSRGSRRTQTRETCVCRPGNGSRRSAGGPASVTVGSTAGSDTTNHGSHGHNGCQRFEKRRACFPNLITLPGDVYELRQHC